MRKALIIVFGLASLGALAGVQPERPMSRGQHGYMPGVVSTACACTFGAFADYCRGENIACNERTHGAAICASTYLDCVRNSKRHHAAGLGFSWTGMSRLPGAATAPAAATSRGLLPIAARSRTCQQREAFTNSGVNSGRNGLAGGGSGLLSRPGMPKLKAQ